MVKMEVNLCDNCENTIARGVCYICGKDVCNPCSVKLVLVASYDDTRIVKTTSKTVDSCTICKKCHKGVRVGNRPTTGDEGRRILTQKIVKAIYDYNVAQKV